ncbi:MAG: hypothetical protein Salg2KO_05360 [Salibacteraceae bacterium]
MIIGSSYYHGYSQEARISQLANLPPLQVDNRSPIEKNREFFLQTPFAKPLIVAASDLFEIQQATVVKVELVYTAYRKSQSFDQVALNENRISALYKQLPDLVENRLIKWELVEQSGCKTPEACDSLFHGFIVTVRHKPTRSRTEIEIADIMRSLSLLPKTPEEAGWIKPPPIKPEDTAAHVVYLGKGLQRTKTGVKPPLPDENGYTPAFYGLGDLGVLDYFKFSAGRPGINDPEEKYDIQLSIDERGYIESVELKSIKGLGLAEASLKKELINMKWYPAKVKGRRVADKVDLTLLVSYSQLGIEKKGKKIPNRKPESLLEIMPLSFDSTVVKVLNRNDWNHMSIIADLTGSMSDYTVQILFWLRIELQMDAPRVNEVVFFNDGNRKSSKLKYIGNTGGIYTSKSDDYKEIEQMAMACMRAGNGGDTPENNLEAVLSAMANCTDCEEFILIADNLATPRDLTLVSKVGRPIRVIACGKTDEINTAYMNIARQTNGSLHTFSEDLSNLADIKEGTQFSFQGIEYEVRNDLIFAVPVK